MLTKKPKPVVSPPVRRNGRYMALAVVGLVVIVSVMGALKLDQISRAASANVGATEYFEVPETGVLRVTNRPASLDWLENAAPFPESDPSPRLAIVVVEAGKDMGAALGALRIAAPLTLAIAPTADSASKTANSARSAGREVLLLLPMQSENRFDTSPNPIAINVPREELIRRMKWNFAQIDGYLGVMNRFGEDVTRDAQTMRSVLEIVEANGLSFIDAREHLDSVAGAVARRMNIPAGDRTVAVKSGANAEELYAGLRTALRHAELWGTAIVTVPAERRVVRALEEWLATLQSEVKIAPVSAVIKRLRSGKT